MKMNPDLLQQHAIAVGLKHGVVIVLDPSFSAYHCRALVDPSVGGKHMIMMCPITCDELYAICLHEQGHCVDPKAQQHHGGDKSLLNAAEAAAWEWARAHAMVWTLEMEQFAFKALRTYTHGGPTPEVPGHPLPQQILRKPVDAADFTWPEEVPIIYGKLSDMPPVQPVLSPAQEQQNDNKWRSGLRDFAKRIKR